MSYLASSDFSVKTRPGYEGASVRAAPDYGIIGPCGTCGAQLRFCFDKRKIACPKGCEQPKMK